MYAVIPVTIDFVNLQYTGKSTLLQMWGHFILSKQFFQANSILSVRFLVSYRACISEFYETAGTARQEKNSLYIYSSSAPGRFSTDGNGH